MPQLPHEMRSILRPGARYQKTKRKINPQQQQQQPAKLRTSI
jgi:hypothetical protein